MPQKIPQQWCCLRQFSTPSCILWIIRRINLLAASWTPSSAKHLVSQKPLKPSQQPEREAGAVRGGQDGKSSWPWPAVLVLAVGWGWAQPSQARIGSSFSPGAWLKVWEKGVGVQPSSQQWPQGWDMGPGGVSWGAEGEGTLQAIRGARPDVALCWRVFKYRRVSRSLSLRNAWLATAYCTLFLSSWWGNDSQPCSASPLSWGSGQLREMSSASWH